VKAMALGVALVAALALIATRPPASAHTARRGRVIVLHYRSPALGRERYALVYEPPGYAALARAGRRLGVLYLLHGAPGRPEQFLTLGHVDRVLDRLYARDALRPMLVVMPYGRVHPGKPDTEWANTRLGRYLDVIVDTVHAVDGRFPTRADRRHRVVAGDSTGGFAAANVTLRHPRLFGAFESWSGYFVEDRSDAFAHEPEANLLANSPALYVSGLRRELRRWPVRAFLYQGAQDTDDNQMVAFALRLRAAGGNATWRIWPGGHNWRLWGAHLPAMLRWASDRMAAP
jgi:enterochelin esterase-like enzyme